MNEITTIFILIILLITPAVLLVMDVVFFFRKKENWIFELIAFFIASIYFALGYALWDLPGYDKPLNTLGSSHAHEPFSSEHALTLIVCILFGFLCYLVLKFGRKVIPPLLEVILLGGACLGAVINLIVMLQLLCGTHTEQFSLKGDDYFFIGCFCAVPIIFLCHLFDLFIRLVREKAAKQASITYEKKSLQRLNLWFLKGANLFWVAILAMLPLFMIIMMILCLFGQQPDSIVLAFTKTSDWILSKEVSPPPIDYDEHYLCTVSLRGHAKVVKPIRCGVRKGRKIIVNRQLCIANAFEQLIMEKTPHFHKAIRNFYDTYGYPLSRKINSAWSADITYILMKPLEWVFIVVLYLLDTDPETRICRQYLPTIPAKRM